MPVTTSPRAPRNRHAWQRWALEFADFLRFCEMELRLAPSTCSAYKRDVSTCLAHLHAQGIRDLGDVKVTHLRAFLAA